MRTKGVQKNTRSVKVGVSLFFGVDLRYYFRIFVIALGPFGCVILYTIYI